MIMMKCLSVCDVFPSLSARLLVMLSCVAIVIVDEIEMELKPELY